LVFLVAAACKPAAQGGAAEVRLATDLNAAAIDTALQIIERNGGPRAERTAGAQEGVAALSKEPQTAAAEVRWDSDPYGAIAAAAVGGRAEVLLLSQGDPTVAGEVDHPPPQRFATLVEPWLKGKVALVAPTSGMALAHFAALYQAWGAEKMEAWLDQLAKNEPQIYATDAEVRAAVVEKRARVGILASDEAAQAVASAATVGIVYPNQRTIGTFVWPTALAVSKTASASAKKLAERLADKSIEALLVARVPGYLPLRAQIPVPPGVRSAANLVVVSVDPSRIVAEIALRKDSLAAWAKKAAGPAH
jgi:ABC-type Fe3+ transport system substrate-binding protein